MVDIGSGLAKVAAM